jgi:RND family efflux transporter MFP subunit
MKLLVDKAYVAKSEHDAAKARFDAADAALKNAKSSVNSRKAALEEAEANLEYALIRAPFDGVVLTKNADIGDIISPMSSAANSKAAVVNIADMSSLQVEADVSESNLGLVKQGGPCEIILDAIPGERFPGRVHMIVPTADRSKASVMVKIRFNKLDPRILPEMSAKVAFLSRPLTPDEQKPRLAVDPSAVTERGGKTVVFRIEEGLARLAPVTVGAPVGDLVEITSGLSQGDVIALRPAKALKDGDAVTIKED